MRKIIFLLLMIVCCFANTYAQNFELKGLEIYNPVYSNPAFTSSDKFVQTDAIAYDYLHSTGYWFNAMSSLPNTNSSVGLSFAGSKYFEEYSSFERDRSDKNVSIRRNSIGLSYAYDHSFTEHLNLSGGIRLIHSIANYSYSTSSIRSSSTSSIKSRNYGSLQSGLKIEYHKLYAGISVHNGLYVWSKRENEANEIEVTRDKVSPVINSNFIAGYSLGGERRVNFDPVIGLRYTKSFDSDFSDFGIYAGGNIIFLKTIGIGFTAGSMLSLSTSVTILNRVNLMLGVYQTEDNNMVSSFFDYSLGFDPLEFILQLRIKL